MSKVAKGHFRRKREAPLILRGSTVTIQGPSPDLTSSVSGLLRDSAYVRQARSPCLRCCPRVAVIPSLVTVSSGTRRARPLRPELAAVLGGWLLSQLTEGAGDSSCLLLSGSVAVSARRSSCWSMRRGARYRPADLPFFRPDNMPSRGATCECRRVLPTAAASRCRLLLLPLRDTRAVHCPGVRPPLWSDRRNVLRTGAACPIAVMRAVLPRYA